MVSCRAVIHCRDVVITGYSGRLCDQDIDECLETNVCNGGTCYNNQGSFSCACSDGYFGTHCEVGNILYRAE